MGARQSKRSVDITTTPKKEGLLNEGGVVGDAAAPGDGKLERIEEADVKPTVNGTFPHTETPEDKDDANEKSTEKPEEDANVGDAEKKEEAAGDNTAAAEGTEATTPSEAAPTSPAAVTSPDSKEAKKKEKSRKKWSFRSISFSKKDKTKPTREDPPKNGDIAKEEPLPEGGEEAETAASPTEEKSAAGSPAGENEASATSAAVAVEAKEEEKPTAPSGTTNSSVAEEKKEDANPAPTPVPEDKKVVEAEKVELAEKVVENVNDVAPAEKTAPVVKSSTTEKEEDAPKTAPAAVPHDNTATPAPVITEDVTSVTKAIEEIGINEKAVAAAVNETIESINTNEIIADACHKTNE